MDPLSCLFLSFCCLIQGLEEGRPQILGVFLCTRMKTRGSESCSVLNLGLEQKKNLYPQFIDLFICALKSVMKQPPNTTLQMRVFSCLKKEGGGLFSSGLCHSATDDSDSGEKFIPFHKDQNLQTNFLCVRTGSLFSLCLVPNLILVVCLAVMQGLNLSRGKCQQWQCCLCVTVRAVSPSGVFLWKTVGKPAQTVALCRTLGLFN